MKTGQPFVIPTPLGTSRDAEDPRDRARVPALVPGKACARALTATPDLASVDEILYVGDRVDNDLRPAVAAGMHTALVHRGPWATIQWRTDEAEKLPTFRVESLRELSGLVLDFNERGR